MQISSKKNLFQNNIGIKYYFIGRKFKNGGFLKDIVLKNK